MKTLQDFINQIAQERGFQPEWDIPCRQLIDIVVDAAELYADYKVTMALNPIL